MKLIKGMGDFFALDIGTNSIRVVELSGGNGNWSLAHHAYIPVDSKITNSDSEESRRRLGEAIMTAIGQSGVKSKNVVVGLPSSKTFTTVIDVPTGSEAELKSTMKYQIDQYIPMSIEARVYSEERLELVESLGLNVIVAEPDPIAMVRAMTPPGNQGALVELDMGETSTDIAIVYGDSPRLVRTDFLL